MDKHALWKWLILLLLVVGSLVVVWPPLDKTDEEGNVIRSGKIRLGLDLKGGTSFTVKIDEEAVEEEVRSRAEEMSDAEARREVAKILEGSQERALEVLRNRIDTLGISEPNIYPGKDRRIIIQLPGINEQKREEAERSIKSLAFLEFRMVHDKNDELVMELFDAGKAPQGFRIARVGGEDVYRRDKSFPDREMDRDYYERRKRFEVPGPDYEFLLQREETENQFVYRPYFVKRRAELTGDYLKDAAVDFHAMGQPVVQLEFDSRGAKRFGLVTADYAPGGARNPDPNNFRQLAIVLDGRLYSAPVIREAIYGGSAEISGSFSLAEANFLANILRAGSLPAPVEIVEKRFVAPSLGTDSIQSGLRAIAYGGIAVLAFMLIYYLISGVIANLALILNMILLPLGMIVAGGFLSIFARDASGGGPIRLPVLTLPGIAGILLTIGMAVDANVLIFERVREESKVGKRLWTAIVAGYDRAFVTILDANLTTLLTGIILFIFGSGPIRGFAVTLCAGILVSMFTALVVTKLFFGLIAQKSSAKALKMLSIVKETKVDFVGKRHIAAVVSVALIVASWGFMVYRGVQNPSAIFGVDFTGGSSVTLTFDQAHRVATEDLRAALDNAGVQDPNIQYQREMEQGGDEYLQVKAAEDAESEGKATDLIARTLTAAFPESAFRVAQEDEVGAQIGAELKRRAVWSIVLALLGIIVYLSWRFEFGFAVGAIVALAHDVLVTVGVYTLFGRQLSLPIVAALLTIVGYSVNDTIVVFDRIREDLRLTRNQNFLDICNLSINQTLSRTLLTSLTTLLVIVMLLVFGGGAINDFALALCIGVLVGTYSSVFVATPVVLAWHRGRKPDLGAKGK